MAEEESKGLKFSDILKVVGGLLVGGALGAGARSAGVLRGAKASDVIKGAALTYPGLTSKFLYPVYYQYRDNGVAFENASVNRDLAEKAAIAQSLDEHNAAVANGTEDKLLSWWATTDRFPRKDFSPGSTAASGVMILPDNRIAVRFQPGGKWYYYRGGDNPRESSIIAKELLTAPSIGRALARNGKFRHTRKGSPGIPDSSLGWWAKEHYDPTYSKK